MRSTVRDGVAVIVTIVPSADVRAHDGKRSSGLGPPVKQNCVSYTILGEAHASAVEVESRHFRSLRLLRTAVSIAATPAALEG
jgi:hypothetical protein